MASSSRVGRQTDSEVWPVVYFDKNYSPGSTYHLYSAPWWHNYRLSNVGVPYCGTETVGVRFSATETVAVCFSATETVGVLFSATGTKNLNFMIFIVPIVSLKTHASTSTFRKWTCSLTQSHQGWGFQKCNAVSFWLEAMPLKVAPSLMLNSSIWIYPPPKISPPFFYQVDLNIMYNWFKWQLKPHWMIRIKIRIRRMIRIENNNKIYWLS